MSRLISMREVSRHNTADDCWLVIHGSVYNLSEFHKTHPGGSKIIVNCAGKDATEPFSAVHPKDLPQRFLPARFILGMIDAATIGENDIIRYKQEVEQINKDFVKPDINHVLNSFDFEFIAKNLMTQEGWSYYSSGADDEITLRENHMAFQRIWLKPRILVNVSKIDLSSSVLNMTLPSCRVSMPMYITATALGKLADPEGELAIVRAAHACNVPYMLPTLSSFSLDEMLGAKHPDQVLFSQIYVNSNRQVTYDYIAKLERNGVKALFITVDAPQLGRREKDMRNKFKQQGTDVQKKTEESGGVDRSQGIARAISSFIDPALDWDAIFEIKKRTKLPIFLKGVQCAEDAVLGLQAGVQGIVLSNHGGRQLDLSRSGIEVLPEVMSALRRQPGYDKNKFEVFIDGGVKRGADIYKAIALGATSVGVGRSVLYALASFGQQGIEHLIKLYKEEMTMCMRLMGTPAVKDISEDHVIIKNLTDHFVPQALDNLMHGVYQPLSALGNGGSKI